MLAACGGDLSNFSLDEDASNVDDEWRVMIDEAQTDKQLGSAHVLAMAHVLRRPILVHGPIELEHMIGMGTIIVHT